MTNANLIQLLISITTILASGIASTVVTYRLNMTKDRFVYMRGKAETLYLAADEWGDKLFGHILSHYPFVKGQATWEEMLDLQLKAGEDKSKYGGAETIIMLVEIYFPEIKPSLDEVHAARDSFNKLINQLKDIYLRSGTLNPPIWVPRLSHEAAQMDKAIKAFHAKIIESARSYAK